MNVPRYPLSAEPSMMVYEFVSEGPNGLIVKVVQYTETNMQGVFNLAFGDRDETGKLDDFSISNNGDREKVLATVVTTVYAFTDKWPDAWVFATGSTKSRTRLYRMGLSKYIDEMQLDFEVYGLFNQEWELFVKGADYEAFLAKRKNA